MDDPRYRDVLDKLSDEVVRHTDRLRAASPPPGQVLGPAGAALARRHHARADLLRKKAEELVGFIVGGWAAGQGRPMASHLKMVHAALTAAREVDEAATEHLWRELGVSQS